MRTIKSFWAIAECLVYAAVYEQMPETHRMWCWQGVPAGGNIVAVRLAGVWLVLSGFASLRLARSSFAFISGGTLVPAIAFTGLRSGGPARAVVPRFAGTMVISKIGYGAKAKVILVRAHLLRATRIEIHKPFKRGISARADQGALGRTERAREGSRPTNDWQCRALRT